MKTFITMVMDETGSMSNRRDTAIDSTNEFINAHKGIENCYASLVTFDMRNYGLLSMNESTTNEVQSNVRFLYEAVAINEVPKLTEDQYTPRGMTNLYDAIGQTITHMETLTKTDPDATVIIMINTDGHENASTEYTGEAIKKLIESKKEAEWQFVFIGEELNTETTRGMSGQLGIDASMTRSVKGSGKAKMFADMAAATTAYAADRGALGPKGARGAAGDAGITLSNYMTDIKDE